MSLALSPVLNKGTALIEIPAITSLGGMPAPQRIVNKIDPCFHK